MKKVYILITTIFLLLIILNRTYAIFYSETSNNTNIELAKFDIKLDNTFLSSSYNTTIPVRNITWQNNHAKSNVVAPGSVGEAILVVDASNVDVAFEFDIEVIDHIVDEEVTLTITELSIDDVVITRENNKYTGFFGLNDPAKTIKIKLEWENNEENNAIDSDIGLGISGLSNVDIRFKARQYVGE